MERRTGGALFGAGGGRDSVLVEGEKRRRRRRERKRERGKQRGGSSESGR